MGWEELYQVRKTTADEAVRRIKPRSVVAIGTGCGEPQTLVDALVDQRERFKMLEIVNILPLRSCRFLEAGMEDHFRLRTLFPSRLIRNELQRGNCDYVPCSLSAISKLLGNRSLVLDVALVQLSPPDKHGYCSFGTSVGFTKLAAQRAKMIIAEINDQMPRTLGDSFIHVSQLDCIVESSRPLITLPRASIGAVERQIGALVAELVPDGATIELGIGAIAEGILLALQRKKDLGIHSGMISDGIIDLYESGAVTNLQKELDKGKIVTAFLVGTEKLFRFADNNPLLEMRTIEYVHNPMIIGQFSKFIAINSALEVDLTGRANAEILGSHRVSGTGGLLDFIRGASYSPEGRSIIALTSTSSDGKYSRIVPSLQNVTIPSSEADYVVTEYGIAELQGKTLRERAKALASISHPRFRDWLMEEAGKL